MLHVGICAGGARRLASLPRPLLGSNSSADSGPGLREQADIGLLSIQQSWVKAIIPEVWRRSLHLEFRHFDDKMFWL
jgi:hypothetical protein